VKRTVETALACLLAAAIAWIVATATLKLAGECPAPTKPVQSRLHPMT
jgi:hypothetical protein